MIARTLTRRPLVTILVVLAVLVLAIVVWSIFNGFPGGSEVPGSGE